VDDLRQGARGQAGSRVASRLRNGLVVAELAASLVLLVGAGLLTKTLRNLEHQDFGITTANRYVVHLDPGGAGYTIANIGVLNEQLEREFSALPGVKSVGLALYSTLEGNNWGEAVYVEGRPVPGPEDNIGSSWDRVSPHFFETIGEPVVRGRGITEQPREILRAAGIAITETAHHGANTQCCGAGGAQLFIADDSRGQDKGRVNQLRFAQLAETGASTVVVACPYCPIMIRDAANHAKRDDIEILDLAEVVAKSIRQKPDARENAGKSS